MFSKRHSTVAANLKLAQDGRAGLADTPVRGVLPEDMLTVTRKDCPKTLFLASWTCPLTCCLVHRKSISKSIRNHCDNAGDCEQNAAA
jgi:hypothetical protein